MDKLTKIIATIGPACDSEEQIESLIKKGVNVFRFNFKHNTVEWHGQRIQRVNKVAKKLSLSVGTLIDLAGPEIRITMPESKIGIKKGEELLLSPKVFDDSKLKGFSITRPDIISHLKSNQHAVADDGAFSFTVIRKGDKVYLRSHTTGTLLNNKSLNIPGANFPLPALIDRDLEGLKLVARHAVDFIALSFVRSQADIRVVRNEAKKFGIKAQIISKIEAQTALDNIDKIIDASDGIMVARGDLGVEIPIEQVPFFQKMIIRKCLIAGKFVITATQMLQSMIESPGPTRAEISDVANAIYDHTDAIMLSGETATGKYPDKAVEVMTKAALFYEPKPDKDIRSYIQYSARDTTAMICDTAYNLYRRYRAVNQPILGFMIFTQSGNTSRLISKYRPQVPIFAFTPNKETCEALSLSFGIIPFAYKYKETAEVEVSQIKQAYRILTKNQKFKSSGKIIVVHGDKWGQGAGATTIRII